MTLPGRNRLVARGVAVGVAVIVTVTVAMVSVSMLRSSSSGGAWNGTRLPSVAFVVTCTQSHISKDDPIAHPGHAGASHEHAFFGNTTTDANSTYRSLQKGSTTCDDSGDRAAYWSPAPAGKYLRAYYDAGDANPHEVVPFPPGAAGLSGNPSSDKPGIAEVAFRCGAVGDGPEANGWHSESWLKCDSGGVVVRYTFGQCGGAKIVPCRSGETKKYVRLRLLMDWRGPVEGLGPHADFLNGWDQSQLADLVAVCVRGERKSNIEIKRCKLNGVGPLKPNQKS
jgi:hypothetical protein